MKKGTIRLIVILMAIAMVSLVSLQLYWISNAIKENNKKFNQHVYEALGGIVNRLEKQKIYSFIKNRLDTSQNQSRTILNANPDSLMALLPSIRSVLLQPDLALIQDPGNGHLMIEDSLMMGDHKIKASYDIQNIAEEGAFDDFDPFFDTPPFGFWDSIDDFQGQLNNEVKKFARTSQMVYNIVNQLYYNEPKPIFHIDVNNLDYIIKSELKDHGINLNYNFGIIDKSNHQDRIILTNLHEGNGHDLLTSNYSKRLFPNNIFPSTQYLTLHFPAQTSYLLKQIWFLLSSSVLLVLLIVFSFFYALSTIIRQKKVSDIKNDFINNMTHEFKTPIATVSLACEALQDPGITKNNIFFQRYVDIIKNENNRLEWQVEKVLQMATLDRQEFKLKLEKTDIHEMINMAVENSRIVIEKRGGSIRESLRAANCILDTDQVHFANILNNLLDNANKYSPDKPEIFVETTNFNNHLIVSISDKGIGMSQEALNKIFEKFYRVPTGNIHDVKGFGLGLSYVKTMCMALGGTIDVKSQPGKGSTFELSFPLNNE